MNLDFADGGGFGGFGALSEVSERWLAELPDDLARASFSAARVMRLRANEVPWQGTGMQLKVGQTYTLFADGRVHFLSETVDGRVYATLLSPQGSRLAGPLAQKVVADSDY